MLIYHTHADTGVYLGSGEALPDPLELELARAAVAAPMRDAARTALKAALFAADETEDELAREAAHEAYQQALAIADEAAAAVLPSLWLIPAHATDIAPPEAGAGHVAIWSAGAWSVEPSVPAEEEPELEPDLAAEARAQRDILIARVRWIIERHRDEVELGLPTTLTAQQHLDILAYVQALRDLPEQPDFPTTIQWPAIPAGIPA